MKLQIKLDKVVKVVGFIKAHRVNSRILNGLCEEASIAHEQLVFILRSAESLLELRDEIRTFLMVSDGTLQGSSFSVICVCSHGDISSYCRGQGGVMECHFVFGGLGVLGLNKY
jgi:hypothetical protein